MWSSNLLGFSLYVTCVIIGTVLSTCDNPLTVNDFRQEECLGTWYQYAGSTPCENCCVTRMLSLIRPGVLFIADYTEIPNKPDARNITFTAKRKAKPLTYYYASESKSTPTLLINVTCDSYAVLKKQNENKMNVFVRQKNAVPKIPDCGIKLYKYHPEKNCVN